MNSNRQDYNAQTDAIDDLLFDERLARSGLTDVDVFHASHEPVLIDKLVHLSRFGNLLTLVLGESGTGKTYLLQRFIDAVDEATQLCHLEAHLALDSKQILAALCQAFDPDGQAASPDSVDGFVNWLDRLQLPPANRLLLIDDADVLSVDTLADICALSALQQAQDQPHLQIMLFANHDLNASLTEAAEQVLAESGIYTVDIPRLDEDDARRFIEIFCAQIGYYADEADIALWINRADGNMAALEQMIESAAEAVDFNDTFDIDEDDRPVSLFGYWFAGLTVVILLVFSVFFYQDELAEWLGANAKEDVVLTPPAQHDETIVERPLVPAQTLPEAESDNEQIDTAELKQELDQQSQDAMATVDEDIPQTPQATPELESEETLIEKTDEVMAESTEPAIDDGPLKTEKSTPAETQSETSPIDTSIITTEVVTESVAEPKKSTAQNLQEPEITEMEQQLLALDPNSYVIQIIGLTNEKSLQELMDRHGKLGLIWFHSALNAKPWKVVILPGFKSRTEARSALENLPADLKKNGPWIKPAESVQEQFRATLKTL